MMTPARLAFLKFLAIGGFAACVNFGSRFAINLVTTYEIAVILAFFIGLLTAFELNRAFIFPRTGDRWIVLLMRFWAVNLVALFQVFVVSVGLARFLFPAIDMTFHPEAIAHAIGLASPLFTSFWLHKHFTFRQRAAAGQ